MTMNEKKYNLVGVDRMTDNIQLGQLRLNPPGTWAPSLGSRVRGCVILEYLKGEQHGSAAVCGLLQREQGDLWQGRQYLTLISDSDIDEWENGCVSPLPQRLFAPPALLFADCDCVETMHCIAILLEIRGGNPRSQNRPSKTRRCY